MSRDYNYYLAFVCSCGQHTDFEKPHEGNVTVWHCRCGKDWRVHIHEKVRRKQT